MGSQRLRLLVRLYNIARFAQLRNSVCVFDGVNVARSLALRALIFSANARDVHFLRALGRRWIYDIAERHDRSVRTALAVICGQAELPAVGVLFADVPDRAATVAFIESYPRLVVEGK